MVGRHLPPLVAAAAVLATVLGSSAEPPPEPVACTRWLATPRQVGRVPRELNELSGLAASRRHAGIFWAHNDSGNAPILFAIREDGSIVARFPLRGAAFRDPEDIAVGPCSATDEGPCIWLGDVGDNGRNRATVEIDRMREPETLKGHTLDVDALPFRYPDGGHDVEALLVDPHAARVFVITKTLSSLGVVYRVDGLGSPGGGTAVRVRELRAPRDFDSYTTAADVHPLGDRLLLRTYARAWELRTVGARALEDVLEADPVEVPSGSQPQGEAIAWLADGRGYLMGSETAGSPIFRVDCAEP